MIAAISLVYGFFVWLLFGKFKWGAPKVSC